MKSHKRAEWLYNQRFVRSVAVVIAREGDQWDDISLECGHHTKTLTSASVKAGQRLYCSECLAGEGIAMKVFINGVETPLTDRIL